MFPVLSFIYIYKYIKKTFYSFFRDMPLLAAYTLTFSLLLLLSHHSYNNFQVLTSNSINSQWDEITICTHIWKVIEEVHAQHQIKVINNKKNMKWNETAVWNNNTSPYMRRESLIRRFIRTYYDGFNIIDLNPSKRYCTRFWTLKIFYKHVLLLNMFVTRI